MKCKYYRYCRSYDPDSVTCNYNDGIYGNNYANCYFKMERKIKKALSLILFIFAIFVLSMIFNSNIIIAQQESLGTFKLNNCVLLKQVCFNCTYINISTISYPNSSLALELETAMINSTITYNYTFCGANDSGTYTYCGHGNVNGVDTPFCTDFLITGSGYDLSISQSIFSTISLIALFVLLGLTTWGAIIFPWKNPTNENEEVIGINDLKYVKVILWVFAYLEFFFIISIFRNLSGIVLILQDAYGLFNIVYWFILISFIPFFPLLLYFTIATWLFDKKTQKYLQHGIRIK